PVDAGALAEHERLGDELRRAADQHLERELDDAGGIPVPEVVEVRADRPEQRVVLPRRLLGPRNDDREVSGSDDAGIAAHGRAQVRDAGVGRRARDALRDGARDRAHVDQRRAAPRAAEDLRGDGLERLVVREHGHADVGPLERLGRRREPGRAALDERLSLRRCAVEDGERVAGVEDPLGNRRSHLPEPDDGYLSIHPPSTSRLTPFTPPFSSRNSAASATSSVVTSRPIGVRVRTASSTASGFPSQAGVSPTMPGWIALTRIGASSTASVWTTPVTPPLTVVTVVEPGYGRRSA